MIFMLCKKLPSELDNCFSGTKLTNMATFAWNFLQLGEVDFCFLVNIP